MAVASSPPVVERAPIPQQGPEAKVASGPTEVVMTLEGSVKLVAR